MELRHSDAAADPFADVAGHRILEWNSCPDQPAHGDGFIVRPVTASR
ncbi:hypothetical protein ACIBF1_18795 [Spirillospora sp. NPDC050679]